MTFMRIRRPLFSLFTAPASVVAIALLSAACAPAYDWREVRSADGAVLALFPCKPQQQTRRVPLAGAEVEMSVIACDAPRSPWPPMHPEVRRQLLDIARRLDPLVLRWAR